MSDSATSPNLDRVELTAIKKPIDVCTADRKEFGSLFDRVRELFGTRSAHVTILRGSLARRS